MTAARILGGVAILLAAIAAPFLAPTYVTQLGILWMMVVLALTWDLIGGQMGYNSFGNIVFFGIGTYAAAVAQRELQIGYYPGFAVGAALGVLCAVLAAFILGSGILRLRGHYFAICTLGLGIAAGELASSWGFIGAGGGMTAPVYPGSPHGAGVFFYFVFAILAFLAFLVLRALYRRRFGLIINAIRDDEDKAEAMGLPTTRYKVVAWMIAAAPLAIAGAAYGHLQGFIDPRDVAFSGETLGVWMVLMAILGGSGTLWGPVIGAIVFDIAQEVLWANFLGWQRVALGLLIVLIVVFFPQGILGWLRETWPDRFGGRGRPAAPSRLAAESEAR
jgi:branched-chain amino acid transport system permease protein